MKHQKKKVAINGFGRIGRAILRSLLDHRAGDLNVVAINDIADIELCAHLLEYDSVYGPLGRDVRVEGPNIAVDDQRIRFTQSDTLLGLDLSDIDIVLECTGKANTEEFASRGLKAGAKRILISGPSDAAETTLVLGANDAALADQKILSNASCTTNALAPLLKVLDDAYGVQTGHMTTIHCYTGSQPTVDAPRGDFARSRAAALSMVPTTTSAMRLMSKVLPHLDNKIVGCAVRVPTAAVSAIDLTVQLRDPPTIDELNQVFANQSGVIGTTVKPLVSSDMQTRPESIVMALPETHSTEAGLIRVFGWYDNEYGFSNRMIDVAMKM